MSGVSLGFIPTHQEVVTTNASLLGWGNVESQGCLWPLVSSSVQGPHQPPGIACSLPSPAVFLAGSGRPSCPRSV